VVELDFQNSAPPCFKVPQLFGTTHGEQPVRFEIRAASDNRKITVTTLYPKNYEKGTKNSSE